MQLARWTMAGWILLTLTGCSPLSRTERAAVIRDSFTAGKPELTWRPYPFFNRDNLARPTPPLPKEIPPSDFSIIETPAALPRYPMLKLVLSGISILTRGFTCRSAQQRRDP